MRDNCIQALYGPTETMTDQDLRDATTAKLIEVLNGPSNGTADVAAMELAKREATSEVATALISGALSRKRGKIRGLFVLQCLGARDSQSLQAYRTLLADKNDDVVDSALFGLVFARDHSALPELIALSKSVDITATRRVILDRAIRALKRDTPSIFSPGYWDAENVWGLRKS